MKRFSLVAAVLLISAFMAGSVVVAWDYSVARAAVAPTSTTATSSLQAQIDADNTQITVLDQQIASYQAQLQQIGADKKTLQAAINSLDLKKSTIETQVAVTQQEINITKTQIQQIGGEISDAQQRIANDLAATGANLRDIQRADNQSLLIQVLAAGNLADIWDDINANLQLGEAVQHDAQALHTQENDLDDSKAASQAKQATLTSQQQSLAAQQQSVAQTVQSKDQLLAETNAKESTYEQLLANAEAQIKGFTTFVQEAGGAALVGNQTICDSWGCYYNQRDSAWGSDSLDGTQYTLADAGCLVASMAMIMTHYGYRTVTPVTINSNSDNFAAYYPASLLTTIVVDGATVTRKEATIDATLATGNPVVVGINAYGGTHFIVFVSGSNGNYLMRDPYIANGKDISFTAHYAVKDIFSIAKVVISS